MLKLLRIWRSTVPVFRAVREVVKACKEARRAHREALANDLDMALEYGDGLWTRLGTCETSSKQDCAIGQAAAHPSYSRDGASRDGCPQEEGLWCGPDDKYTRTSGRCGTAALLHADGARKRLRTGSSTTSGTQQIEDAIKGGLALGGFEQNRGREAVLQNRHPDGQESRSTI